MLFLSCSIKWPFNTAHHSVFTPPLSLFCALPLFSSRSHLNSVDFPHFHPAVCMCFTFSALPLDELLGHPSHLNIEFPFLLPNQARGSRNSHLCQYSFYLKPLTAKPGVNHIFITSSFPESAAVGLPSPPHHSKGAVAVKFTIAFVAKSSGSFFFFFLLKIFQETST